MAAVSTESADARVFSHDQRPRQEGREDRNEDRWSDVEGTTWRHPSAVHFLYALATIHYCHTPSPEFHAVRHTLRWKSGTFCSPKMSRRAHENRSVTRADVSVPWADPRLPARFDWSSIWLVAVTRGTCCAPTRPVPNAGLTSVSSTAPAALFAIVVVGASLCAITSLMVLAHRPTGPNEAELGYLGLFFFAMSILAARPRNRNTGRALRRERRGHEFGLLGHPRRAPGGSAHLRSCVAASFSRRLDQRVATVDLVRANRSSSSWVPRRC